MHHLDGFFTRRRGLRPLTDPAVRPVEPRLMDCGGAEPMVEDRVGGRMGGLLRSAQPQRIARRFPGAAELPLKAEPRVRVPVELPAGGPTTVGLKVAAPEDARPGSSFIVHLVQRTGSRIVGGVAVEVRIPGTHGEAT